MDWFSMWIFLIAILAFAAVLYIVYLKVQLAVYKSHTVVVTQVDRDSGLGCLGTIVLALLGAMIILVLAGLSVGATP